MSIRRFVTALGLPVLMICFGACRSESPAEPGADKTPEKKPAATAAPKPSATAQKPKPKPKPVETKPRKVTAKPVATVEVAEGDPQKGQFTLADATKGLAKGNKLIAEIETELGTLECELYDDKAPITVANFIGLSRGSRAWKDKGQWVKKPLYDGTTFHRVIKGFMIQGGDPNGNGSGGPGFVIPDEIWEDAYHDQRGQLCMANRGPNTNGSQFFIMDGKAQHLDGGYTIFGKCSPDDVIEKLASVPVRGDKAVTPVKIRKVTIKRIQVKEPPPAPSGSVASGASSNGAPPSAAPSAAKLAPKPAAPKPAASAPVSQPAPTPAPAAPKSESTAP
ncbi:MAG TPA: peptidylprolyl isomerase [Polyangiaceae bacterium]|jgi:peptidyl-prolyl cis-trans isomerase A (cyclophilin A)|nr:peptidylprolyl isomerase [Polyangiaceae bacterium]